MKLHKQRPDEEAPGVEEAPNTDDFYEVEDIRGMRKVGRRYEYLVKWRGYPESDNQWEPYSSFTPGARLIIQAFRRKQGSI